MRATSLFGLLFFVAACATTSPIPIRAGDVCFNCRRTIANPQVAAELIDQEARAFKFSSIGCLAEYLRDHPNEGAAKAIFVTDYVTGRLFPVDEARFVKFVVDPRVNALDFAAFRAERAARAFAAEKRSTVVGWDTAQKDATMSHAD